MLAHVARGALLARKAAAATTTGGAALSDALKSIEQRFGKGALMPGSAVPRVLDDVFPSGSLSLDIALGTGGFGRQRIVEVYGPESSGKTTLALSAIAQAQRRGGACTFIDVEHAFDPVYAEALGVDTEKLYIAQPQSGEQALEMVDTLVASKAMDCARPGRGAGGPLADSISFFSKIPLQASSSTR